MPICAQKVDTWLASTGVLIWAILRVIQGRPEGCCDGGRFHYWAMDCSGLEEWSRLVGQSYSVFWAVRMETVVRSLRMYRVVVGFGTEVWWVSMVASWSFR